MSKTISMTLPDAVSAALEAKGAPLEMSGSEFLKQFVLGSSLGEMPPLRLADIVADYELRRKCAGHLLTTPGELFEEPEPEPQPQPEPEPQPGA
jgi:hypothetical protein